MRRLTSICWFVRVYITEDGRGNVDVDLIISSAIAVQTRTVKKKKKTPKKPKHHRTEKPRCSETLLTLICVKSNYNL